MSKRCTQCGEVDRFRVVRGLGELSAYVASGAVAIGLTMWIASNFF